MSFTVRTLKDQQKKSLPWKQGLLACAGVVGSLVSFHQWKKHKETQQEGKRVHLLKRSLLVLIAILVSLVVLGGIVHALISLNLLTAEDVRTVAGNPPPVDSHGYTNLLLLGQGDADHDGVDLTDTIMIASIDAKVTQSIVLISIPRDVQIATDFFNESGVVNGRKINSIYRDIKIALQRQGLEDNEAGIESMKQVAKEIGNKLNIDIHQVAKVDFEGFIETVDAIGGVTVDVPFDIIDTEYPNKNWGYETFQVSAGSQTFDGATALKYARSRHSTSDYDRSARQQQILSALGHKAKEDGILTKPNVIAGIFRALSKHIHTTMTLRDIIGLTELAENIDREKIITLQFNDRNGLYNTVPKKGGLLYAPPRNLFDGRSVLLPVSIPEFPITWKQPKALMELLQTKRLAYLEKPTISVLNAGAPSGHARKLANELTRFGFDVTNVSNASSDDQPNTTISAQGESFNTSLELLQNLLTATVSPLPDLLPSDEVADITIILGKDFSYSPFQNLINNLRAT